MCILHMLFYGHEQENPVAVEKMWESNSFLLSYEDYL